MNTLRAIGSFLRSIFDWVAIGFLAAMYLVFSILSIVLTVMLFAAFIFVTAAIIVLCWKFLAVALV